MKSSKPPVRTIGLVLEDANTDFGREILRSVIHAVTDRMNLRLVLISGRQDDNENREDFQRRYRSQYNQIFRMNERFRFDGLLLTFPNLNQKREFDRGIPRVHIAIGSGDELTVNYEDETGIREAIDYLVKIKGVTKLAMLGGRDDNPDACKRKRIFRQCLEDNGLTYSENQFEKTDMTPGETEAAGRLLARNPDVQGIFCVNDAVASALYEVLKRQGRIPGRDVFVFGFDNGPLARELEPPLASVGADGTTLGKKALEMLVLLMDGEQVVSQTIPTRLYGRASLEYEKFEFTARELFSTDPAFINNFFDACFYRYHNESVSPGAINLRRLFQEILSRMLKSVKYRYMSEEEYEETARLIEIFFRNGAMQYTEPDRFVHSISRLQSVMNESSLAGYTTKVNNRLLAMMKDEAICVQGIRVRMGNKRYREIGKKSLDFLIWTTNYLSPGDAALDAMIRRMDRIGVENAALFLYNRPVFCREEHTPLPETIRLRCVLRNSELFEIPEERQECRMADLYHRSELPAGQQGFISYPLFYGKYLFGMLVCHADEKLLEIGESLTCQIGRSIYLNWVTPEETVC